MLIYILCRTVSNCRLLVKFLLSVRVHIFNALVRGERLSREKASIEDNTHGAAVVTMLQYSRGDKTVY